MLPTHRLFGIIQILRGAKHPVRAKQLAEEFEVSIRTIYRDIAELQRQQVPIHGEAGIGYALQQGYDLPPLMLTPGELEAALLGASWVSQRGDSSLARDARDLMSKISAILPAHLQRLNRQSTVVAPNVCAVLPDAIEMDQVREAIRHRYKIQIGYTDTSGCDSTRRVWPFMMAYFESVRVMVAWCELRQDFRHFRTDRISMVTITSEQYPQTTAALTAQWQQRELQHPPDS